ncbi:hypothetical protein AVEN_203319-1 [Araneus ventricosus]|uniref:Uncharacterized protein n=1 Tax=Araneus ventricosus TaxID=182803 RepID=A0A4Y2EN10_ARAVE|nr:hypothetical protein AVEN_203319-1 [Araneus ventricosus]
MGWCYVMYPPGSKNNCESARLSNTPLLFSEPKASLSPTTNQNSSHRPKRVKNMAIPSSKVKEESRRAEYSNASPHKDPRAGTEGLVFPGKLPQTTHEERVNEPHQTKLPA